MSKTTTFPITAHKHPGFPHSTSTGSFLQWTEPKPGQKIIRTDAREKTPPEVEESNADTLTRKRGGGRENLSCTRARIMPDEPFSVRRGSTHFHLSGKKHETFVLPKQQMASEKVLEQEI